MANTMNGGAKLAGAIIGIVTLVSGGLLLYADALSRVAVTEAVINVVREHPSIPGHPIVMERVDELRRDVREIRGDVKEVLRRLPP